MYLLLIFYSQSFVQPINDKKLSWRQITISYKEGMPIPFGTVLVEFPLFQCIPIGQTLVKSSRNVPAVEGSLFFRK